MLHHSTDTKLIEDLQQDSEIAFAGIYNQYHQAILANIGRLVANQHDAEDILQEVFITLWDNRYKLILLASAALGARL